MQTAAVKSSNIFHLDIMLLYMHDCYSAVYDDVVVVSKSREECRQSGSMVIPVMAGSDQYLASVVTEETDCGSLDTPWTLRAPPGQTIHIHLLNFQTVARPPPDTQHGVPRVCQV